MPTVRLAFTPAAAHVRTARLVAVAVARRAGVSSELYDEIRLAIGEACSRAVALHRQYGLADLVEVALSDGAGFTIRVTDRAPIDAALSPPSGGADPVALMEEAALGFADSGRYSDAAPSTWSAGSGSELTRFDAPASEADDHEDASPTPTDRQQTGHPTPGPPTPGPPTPGQATPGQATPGQATPGQATPGQAQPSHAAQSQHEQRQHDQRADSADHEAGQRGPATKADRARPATRADSATPATRADSASPATKAETRKAARRRPVPSGSSRRRGAGRRVPGSPGSLAGRRVPPRASRTAATSTRPITWSTRRRRRWPSGCDWRCWPAWWTRSRYGRRRMASVPRWSCRGRYRTARTAVVREFPTRLTAGHPSPKKSGEKTWQP